jgi:hypothetical protein
MSLLTGVTFTCSGQEQTITVLLLMKWQDLALVVMAIICTGRELHTILFLLVN